VASFTVTTPVLASIWNRPPASSVSEYVTVPPCTSLDDAVTPTVSWARTPSETVLAPVSLSLGCVGATL